MEYLTRTAMLFVQKTLDNCQQCTGFLGVVLANSDGLILAANGDLSGDGAAACASSLMLDAATSLSFIGEGKPKTMLLWSGNKLLSLQKLEDDSTLLLISNNPNASEEVRHFTEQTASRIEYAMNLFQ